MWYLRSSPLRTSPRRLFIRFFSSSNPNPNAISDPGPKPKSLDAIIDSLFRERNLDQLAARFKESSNCYRFRCKHRIYEITVRRLAVAGRLDAVSDILEFQKQYTSDIAREGFAVRLISLYGKAGMASHAADTFHQLPSLGCPRTVMSFNALLSAYADAGDAERLVGDFLSLPSVNPDIVPNVVSYNIMIHALCERCDLDLAIATLESMEKSSVAPDLITFNTLLKGLYQNKLVSEAEMIWAKMAEKKCEVDIRSYNAKLRWLVSEGRMSEAVEELIGELPSRGLKPNIYSFNALIEGYCTEGSLGKAKKVFEELIKNDCAPNRKSFETLVPRLCKNGELDLAVKLCKDSMSRRCYVGAEVVQGVVDGLVKDSRVEDAKKLVELGRLHCYSSKSLRMPLPSLAA